jgi:ferritin-like metal-binding protein YciE
MSRYGTLAAWAKQMGRMDCAGIFETTLKEEKAADQKLTTIAESQLNRQAAM